MKLKKHFYIDLIAKNPSIEEYSPDVIQEDLEFYDFDNPLQLADYDWKVFTTEKAAIAWLEKFNKTKALLDNKKICVTKDVPTILYKRRYIVQTLMGEKLQTFRNSDRVHKMMSKVRIGGMFNLNDQTYFLTVVLKKVEIVDKKQIKYIFALPSNTRTK